MVLWATCKCGTRVFVSKGEKVKNDKAAVFNVWGNSFSDEQVNQSLVEMANSAMRVMKPMRPKRFSGRVRGTTSPSPVSREVSEQASLQIQNMGVALYSKYFKSSSTDEKIQRLKSMKPFLLDNSMREPTVCSIYGHVSKDKDEIIAAVDRVGAQLIVVGAFGDLERVEDSWLLNKLQTSEAIDPRYTIFTEMVEWTPQDQTKAELIHLMRDRRASYHGEPVTPQGLGKPLPLGLLKATEYKVPNLILELNCNCPIWDSTYDTKAQTVQASFAVLLDHVDNMLRHTRERLGDQAQVFINLRDMMVAWNRADDLHSRSRLLAVAEHVSRLKHKITGFCFEDPDGEIFPWELTDAVGTLRNIMDTNGWKDGEVLCHIHKKYGLADACVLEALSVGATGVWCSASPDGAGWGHASSLVTLTNLARLGNPHVAKMFNMPALYEAAVLVTKVSTGHDPRPEAEVCGDQACDVVFGDFGGMGSDGGFNLAQFLGRKTQWRITTFADTGMMSNHLASIYGEYEWPEAVLEKMRVQVHNDLVSGNKWQYQCPVCMFDLYQRCGGTDNLVDMAETVRNKMESMMQKPAFKAIKKTFVHWDPASCGDSLTYKDFFRAFLSRYTEQFNSNLVSAVMALLDIEADGKISFSNLGIRAGWTWNQWPDECALLSPDEFIHMVMVRNVIPEASEVLLQKINDLGTVDAAGDSASTKNLQPGTAKKGVLAQVVNAPTADHGQHETPKASSAAPAPAPAPAPLKPQVFSIMRNGHEVLRGCIRDCAAALDAKQVDQFGIEWRSFKRWEVIHAKMEEGDPAIVGPRGVFGVLNDEFDGIATKSGLFEAHQTLHSLEQQVSAALEACEGSDAHIARLTLLVEAFAAFQTFELAHYKREESVMMKHVRRLAMSGTNMRNLVNNDLLPQATASPDFEFWVKFAMGKLEKHHEGKPRARVFAHALIACGAPAQQSLWMGWVKASLSPGLFNKIAGLLKTPYVWTPFGTALKERGPLDA